MNRRSVIRCILGLAAAPKILAEMDFKPPLITYFSDTTFDGIFKWIDSNANSYSLTPYEFQDTWNKAQLSYFEDIIQKYGNQS